MSKGIEDSQITKNFDNEVLINEYPYHKGVDNPWNNPVTMNKKIYNLYHKSMDESKQIVTQKIEKDLEYKKALEDLRRQEILQMKSEDKERYYYRHEKRVLIQNKSKQSGSSVNLLRPINPEQAPELIAQRGGSMKHLNQNENNWNYFGKLNKKYVKQYLTPTVIKGEEQFLEMMKKAIEQQKADEEENEKNIFKIRETIRKTLTNKRKQNLKILGSLGLVSENKNNLFSTPREKVGDPLLDLSRDELRDSSLCFSRHPNSPRTSMTNETKSLSPSKIVNSSIEGNKPSQKVSCADRLAIPKKKTHQLSFLERPDIQKSLIACIDRSKYHIPNDFGETLINRSKVVKDIIKENQVLQKATDTKYKLPPFPGNLSSLPSDSTARPFKKGLKSMSKEKQIIFIGNNSDIKTKLERPDPRQNVFNELDLFEEKFSRKPGGVRYPRIALDEISKVSGWVKFAGSENSEEK